MNDVADAVVNTLEGSVEAEPVAVSAANCPYVNVFASDSTWLGMFLTEDAARSWVKRMRDDASTCEIAPVGTRVARSKPKDAAT